jgi:hypothetical protein
MPVYDVFITALGKPLRIGSWRVQRKAELWDKIARHYQFVHFKTMCEAQGLDIRKTKDLFTIVEVSP